MTEKIITKKVLKWYDLNKRNLPWRKKIPLYNFLGTNVELSNTPYFPHVSFDKYKYIKSNVPFYYKWKLNECIKRDKKRTH